MLKTITANFNEIFIRTDQPTCCPQCGSRTEIVSDFTHINSQLQIHFCVNPSCLSLFVEELGQEMN